LRQQDVNAERLAQQIGVSPRTLHRRLHEHSTSYQMLLDIVRYELAQSYLGERHLAIDEVAFLLGFAGSVRFIAPSNVGLVSRQESIVVAGHRPESCRVLTAFTPGQRMVDYNCLLARQVRCTASSISSSYATLVMRSRSVCLASLSPHWPCLGERPTSVKKRLPGPVHAHGVVPARHYWKAVWRLPLAAAELHGK
jgi:AraC-like DNA-binding protein